MILPLLFQPAKEELAVDVVVENVDLSLDVSFAHVLQLNNDKFSLFLFHII